MSEQKSPLREAAEKLRDTVERKRAAAAKYLDHADASSGAHAVVGVCDRVLADIDVMLANPDAPEPVTPQAHRLLARHLREFAKANANRHIDDVVYPSGWDKIASLMRRAADVIHPDVAVPSPAARRDERPKTCACGGRYVTDPPDVYCEKCGEPLRAEPTPEA